MPSTKPKPKLGDKRWEVLKPKCVCAGAYSEESIKAWAAIAAEAVSGASHADWRWLLADLRERCFDNSIECPYTMNYLIQLAETYEEVDGNLDRGVPVSVLIEGRNLDNLLDVVTPGMTVARMKALVYKRFNQTDKRSVEEVEASQKGYRLDGRERATRKGYVDKIEGWKLDKANKLLPQLQAEATAYQNAVVRLRAEGAAFDPGQVAVAQTALRNALSALDALPKMAQAA